MSEKAGFQVDSRGVAEQTLGERSKKHLVTHEHAEGMVIGSESELYSDPTSPEAQAYGEYYVDANGRIIEISTGNEVAPGSGRVSSNTNAIKDYEARNK